MSIIKQIRWIKGGFIALYIILVSFLNQSLVSIAITISGLLLGFLVLFLVTIIIKSVLQSINKASKEFKRKFKQQINKSIDDEVNSENYNKRIQICEDRVLIYEKASTLSSRELYLCLKLGLFFSFTALILSLFPEFKIPTTLIHNYHIIYAVLLVGLYYTIKIIIIFLELIRSNIKN